MALARSSESAWLRVREPWLSVFPSTRTYMPRAISSWGTSWLLRMFIDSASRDFLPGSKLMVTGLVNTGVPVAAILGWFLGAAAAARRPWACQLRRMVVLL